MLKAKDVMTLQVISVQPDNTVGEVAEKLMKYGISAVPVVDGERIVGILSEGDLVRRAEIGTAERHRSWWLRLFTGAETLATEYVKSHARRVRDVMTKNVISVSEETSLSDIAALLEKNHIKRVPVLRDGRVVGIVSRANLLRRLATFPADVQVTTEDDRVIRAKILEALRSQPWSNVNATDVTVAQGRVEFWGMFDTNEQREAARVVAENVPGVRKVEDHRVRTSDLPGYL